MRYTVCSDISTEPAVDDATYIVRVDFERSAPLARRAVVDPDLLVRVLIERAKDGAALLAVELDILELREYTTATRDDAADAYERVQVRASEIAQRVRRRDIGDARVDLTVDVVVLGKVDEHAFHDDLGHEVEHSTRTSHHEERQERSRIGEVDEGDFERLGVHWMN